MEPDRTPAKPLLEHLKTRLFRNNNRYLRALRTSSEAATLVILVQSIQVLGLTSCRANPHVETWIAAFMSTLNLESVRDSPIALLLAISAATLINLLLVLALLLNGTKQDIKLLIARVLQVYCRLALIPNLGNFFYVIFQGNQYLYIALAGLLLQLALYSNDELLYFNFSLETKDGFTRNPRTKFQLCSKLLVLVVGCIPAVRQHQIALILLVVANIGYGMECIRQNCNQTSYNDPRLAQLEGVCQVLTLAVNCCYLLMWLINIEMIENNRLMMLVIVQVFVLKFFLNFRNYRLQSLINDGDKVTNELQADLFFKCYVSIFKTVSNKEDKLYISSLLKMHINQCEDAGCCCKRRNKLYDSTKDTYGNEEAQPHQDHVFVKHYLLKTLRDSLDRFPTSTLLTIDMGFYRVEFLWMYCKTADTICQLRTMVKKGRLPLSQQFLVYQLEELLMGVLEEKNCKSTRSSLEIQNIRLFDEELYELSKQIVTATSNFCQMWELIANGASKSMKALSENCTKNLRAVLDIDKQYRELLLVNSYSNELKDIMELYSRFVLFDYQLASEVAKQIKHSHNEQRFNHQDRNEQFSSVQMFGSGTCMLSISHQLSTIGQIMWASKSTLGVLGYHRQQLLKTSINKIMPSVFSRYHDDILLNWRDKGIEYSINRFKESWAIDSDGYCIGCRIYAKVLPNQERTGIQLLGFLQRMTTENSIVLDEQGDISCVGRDFSKFLKLEPAQLKESYLNIQLLCAELFSSFKLVGQDLPKLTSNSAVATGKKFSCFMCIPRKLSSLLKTLMFKKQNLLSGFGLDKRTKNYDELNDSNTFLLRIQYLLYLNTQLQLLAEEESDFYRVKMILTKIKFYNGCMMKEYCVINITSVKRSENYEPKYLDVVESVSSAVATYLTKLKKQAKEMENRKEEALVESKIASNLQNTFRGFRGVLQTTGANVEVKKKLASLTIKILKGSQTPSPVTKKISQNRRESDFHTQIRDSKPVDEERVARNIQRIRLSLLRQGILSMRMLEAFNISHQQSVFAKHRLNVYQTACKTGIDQNDSVNFEEETARSSDKLILGDLEREQDIKLGSVASSTANISMNSAIKSLKEELRKLRPPKILVTINRLLIGTFALLLLLFTFDCLSVLNKSNKYMSAVKTTEDADMLQQNLRMSFDSILLHESIVKFNGTAGWSQSLINRTQEYLAKAARLLLAQNKQIIQSPSLLRGDALGYLRIKFLDDHINGPYQFILLQLYTAYMSMFFSRSRDTALLYEFAVHTYSGFTSIVQKSLEFNFQLTEDQLESLRQYMFYIAVGEVGLLLICLCALLAMTAKLLRKMVDTLNLFSKVSQRDITRYFNHFISLRHQFESGSKVSQILQHNLNDNNEQKEALQSRKSSRRPLDEVQDNGKCRVHAKILLLVVLLVLVLAARVATCWLLIVKFSDTTAKFENIYRLENALLERRVEFKLLLKNITSMARSDFDAQFQNKKLLLAAELSHSYSQQFAGEGYRKLMRQLISTNVCSTVLKLADPSRCELLGNGSLTFGIVDGLINIDSFMYQNGIKLIEKQGALDILLNNSFRELEDSNYYIDLALDLLHQEMIATQNSNILLLSSIAIYYLCAVAAVLLGGLLFGWRMVYNHVSEESSFANAFLLLLPYSVLKENPYVKVYIKNEFNVNGLSRV